MSSDRCPGRSKVASQWAFASTSLATNQRTSSIRCDERILSQSKLWFAILLSWNGPISNNTRSESCERWPEWIWAELPSTIPY
jgi:hypothetical protein